jgi:Holliday junction resolvase
MKATTFEHLKSIHDKFGPGIFGKIAQKLLALAFCDAGFSHIVERGVQGVDIDAANPEGMRYTLEVKTTEGESILISEENIEALKDRAKDGYVPLIAVLRVRMFEDWMFANVPLSDLRPGSLALSRLRAYRVRDLETLVRPIFEAVVNQHFGDVLARGERYLSEILAQRRGGHT